MCEGFSGKPSHLSKVCGQAVDHADCGSARVLLEMVPAKLISLRRIFGIDLNVF